jgi:arginase
VDTALDSHRFPIVLGGDCSILLGPMLALRRRGHHGLVFIDGHADFQHPSDEPYGEVASLDLALVTGRGPEMLADLDGLGPLVRDEDVALIGYRVFGDNDQVLGEHVRDTSATVIDLPEVRERGTPGAVRKALTAASRPGGISWEEATDILCGLLTAEGARGLDVTIFNPRLDPDGSLARRLSDLIATVVPVSGMR